MNQYKLFFLLFAVMSFSFMACDDDDPIIVDDEELITTVTVTLTPQSGGNAVVLNFSDPDGDGGMDPVIDGGTLAANTTYTAAIVLLNESETPAENITEEIEEEDEDHQFFFATSGGLDLTVAYADADANGNPIGLATTVTTGAASTGEFTVILRHEPMKDAQGVKDGDIANAGGETDIEVNFPVEIQ